jgi:UDP-2,4-diacetamido-2,4,6-trideoxy-beta-L-altropyranose hydrolase
VILIDDMAHLGYYDVDLIVNPNAHAASLAYRTPATTRLLLGPAYVLLRREFDKLAFVRRRNPPVARRLLVTLGGADPHDMTSRVLRAIRRLGKPDLEVTVVIGAANPRVASLITRVSALPGPTHVVVGADDMAPIYASADLAVSAGGTSVWELAHAGTPSLLLETGPSERMLLSGLKAIGLFEQIGDVAAADESAIAERIAARLADAAWRAEMSARGRGAVDGRGRSRVLAAMAALGQRREAARIGHAVPRLALRPAGTEDRERLWHWANDPEVRQVSFHGAPIPWEDHVQWLDARLNDRDFRMYIGLVGDVPAGVVRFQRVGSIAEISVALAAEYRGHGIGPRLIKLASDRYLKETDVERVDAIVKADNERSIRAFREAGFSLPAQGHSSPRSPSGAVGMVLPR